MKIWLNGSIAEAGRSIDAADRGFLIGDGVFETLFVRDGTPAFLDGHLERLHRGLRATEIAVELPPSLVTAIVLELSRLNGIAGDAQLRITVSRGPGGRGVLPAGPRETAATVLLSLEPLAKRPDRIETILVDQRRFSGRAAAGFKAIDGYGDSRAALREAQARGADEALMLNERGALAGASAGNVFVLFADGTAATPPVSEGAMPGVTRSVLLRCSAAANAPITERPVLPSDLAAGSLIVTSALRGVATANGAWDTRAARRFAELKSLYEAAQDADLEERRAAS